MHRIALPDPALSASDLLRDVNATKNKFALGIVGEYRASISTSAPRDLRTTTDRAAKSLCEVWRPQDIPPAFNSKAHPFLTSLPSFRMHQCLNKKSEVLTYADNGPMSSSRPTRTRLSLPTSSTTTFSASSTPQLSLPLLVVFQTEFTFSSGHPYP